MAKRKFDLSSMMDTVSKLDTSTAPEIRMIPLEDILDNKANFYKVDKASLQPLADSIAMDGLQQYPVVREDPEQEGKYLLLSGHRRAPAIGMLAAEGREDLRLVPCTVKKYKSEAMAELQLILANSTTRVLTNAEISKQAERMEMLLYQLKEEGYEFPGRMRDQVAAACKVSAPKLARLKVIREKLKAPEFLLLFEKDKLPEQTAYALARLPEELQKRLAAIQPDLTGNLAECIRRKSEPDMACPDGKACKRGDSFLRHDLECGGWEMCGGKKCCLECERAKAEYYPCSRMCAKAQALRKEKRDEKKAQKDARAQEQTKMYQKETAVNARRVLLAVEAAGLADEEEVPWAYFGNLTVERIRAYAAGEFPPDERWHEARLRPEQLNDPARTATLLGCSADYLLGLTDELRGGAPEEVSAPDMADDEPRGASLPACGRQRPPRQWREAPLPVWLPGVPERSGPVAARFSIPGVGCAMTNLCWYDAAAGRYLFSEDGATIDAECTGWWPVPDEEDNHADDQ